MSDVSVTTDAGDAAGHSVAQRDGPGLPQRGPGGDLAGHIGRRLAAYRGQRGMRVAELAREVGVTPSLISQIERGLSRPSVSTLFAIAQALARATSRPPRSALASPRATGRSCRRSFSTARRFNTKRAPRVRRPLYFFVRMLWRSARHPLHSEADPRFRAS